MSSLNPYISVIDIKEKFKHSRLLSLLVRIYQVTNGFQAKSSILLSKKERLLIDEECSQENFNPSWALMTCFGSMLPNNGELTRAVDKFKHYTSMEIIVIINSKVALINIQAI